MKKILVTGGAGFIGSNFLDEIESQDCQILVLDDFSSGKLENLKDKLIDIEEISITDYGRVKTVIESFRPNIIYHFAAIASVQASIEKPLLCESVNLAAGKYILDLAIENSLEEFYFCSSAAVYGDPGNVILSEESPTSPISAYGKQKLEFENYLKLKETIRTVSFRFFNVFGPRQDPSSPYAGVISLFLKAFQTSAPEVNIYGTGEQCRDFIFIKDLVESIKFLARNGKNGEVYNIGTGKSHSVNEVLSSIERITGKKAQIDFMPAKKGDISFSRCDNTKLTSLGFQTKYSLEDGLRKLEKWFCYGNR